MKIMGTDICILFEYYNDTEKCWYAMKMVGKSVWILSDKELNDLALFCKKTEEVEDIDVNLWQTEGLMHDTNRGYPLFTLLAGLRQSNIQPLSSPRGFPETCSYRRNSIILNEFNYNHTFTYYTLTELINANTEYNRRYAEYERMNKIIAPIIEFCKERKESSDDIRAIISFN